MQEDWYGDEKTLIRLAKHFQVNVLIAESRPCLFRWPFYAAPGVVPVHEKTILFNLGKKELVPTMS